MVLVKNDVRIIERRRVAYGQRQGGEMEVAAFFRWDNKGGRECLGGYKTMLVRKILYQKSLSADRQG